MTDDATSNPPPASLAKRLLLLAGWYLLTLMLADGVRGFRGERLLYYYAMPLVPAAVFFNAKHFPRLSFPLCYGLICGCTFGFPIIDPRAYYWGTVPSLESMLERILIYTFFSVIACFMAFAAWLMSNEDDSPERG